MTELDTAPQPTGSSVASLRLSVLIPVFNSETTIGPLVDVVVESLFGEVASLEIILVNDGSRDRSHESALATVEKHPGIVKYVKLARNFGEHNAVMCGLHYVTGDCVAIIDDDFQNPPREILRLMEKMVEGYDVVYSYYEKKRHNWFRNLGSRFNDYMATKLLRKPPDLYLSSFKVMNAFLVRAVIQYEGPYPYIDGLVLRATSSIGKQLCEHSERSAGRSNYTLVRLMRLWLNMFTSFSVLPLRVASVLGLVMSAFGFLLALFFILSWTVGGIFLPREIPPGWASLIVTITVFAGLQLCVLGMIGEYLGRLFITENRAPQFVVREHYGLDASSTKEAK